MRKESELYEREENNRRSSLDREKRLNKKIDGDSRVEMSSKIKKQMDEIYSIFKNLLEHPYYKNLPQKVKDELLKLLKELLKLDQLPDGFTLDDLENLFSSNIPLYST